MIGKWHITCKFSCDKFVIERKRLNLTLINVNVNIKNCYIACNVTLFFLCVLLRVTSMTVMKKWFFEGFFSLRRSSTGTCPNSGRRRRRRRRVCVNVKMAAFRGVTLSSNGCNTLKAKVVGWGDTINGVVFWDGG